MILFAYKPHLKQFNTVNKKSKINILVAPKLQPMKKHTSSFLFILSGMLLFCSCVHDSLVEENESQPETPFSITYEPDQANVIASNPFESSTPVVTGEGPFQFTVSSTPTTSEISIDNQGIISASGMLAAGNYVLDISVTHPGGTETFPSAFSLDVLAPEAITFSNQIQSLFQSKCAGCHTSGPQTIYTDYTNASQNISLILTRIQLNPSDAGFMPRGGNSLSNEEIELIKQWQANGLPE